MLRAIAHHPGTSVDVDNCRDRRRIERAVDASQQRLSSVAGVPDVLDLHHVLLSEGDQRRHGRDWHIAHRI